MTFTTTQAALLDRARQDGPALDPERPDDAAVLLRAERLVLDGANGAHALARARAELVASRATRAAAELVYCATCGVEKPFTTRPDVRGLLFPVCGHAPFVDAPVYDTPAEIDIDTFLNAKGGA